jgi:hypothetical protein
MRNSIKPGLAVVLFSLMLSCTQSPKEAAAKQLKGADRQAFMKTCLSGSK